MEGLTSTSRLVPPPTVLIVMSMKHNFTTKEHRTVRGLPASFTINSVYDWCLQLELTSRLDWIEYLRCVAWLDWLSTSRSWCFCVDGEKLVRTPRGRVRLRLIFHPLQPCTRSAPWDCNFLSLFEGKLLWPVIYWHFCTHRCFAGKERMPLLLPSTLAHIIISSAFFMCGEGLSWTTFITTSLWQLFQHTFLEAKISQHIHGYAVRPLFLISFAMEAMYTALRSRLRGTKGFVCILPLRVTAVPLLDSEEGVFAIPSFVGVAVYLGHPCTRWPTLVLLSVAHCWRSITFSSTLRLPREAWVCKLECWIDNKVLERHLSAVANALSDLEKPTFTDHHWELGHPKFYCWKWWSNVVSYGLNQYWLIDWILKCVWTMKNYCGNKPAY